jgi:hypothetical protein
VVAIPHFLLPGMRHTFSVRDSDGLTGFSTQLLFDTTDLVLQVREPSSQVVVITTESEELVVKLFKSSEVGRERRSQFFLSSQFLLVGTLILVGEAFAACLAEVQFPPRLLVHRAALDVFSENEFTMG